ncbi:hypothetical protein CU097_007121 [Rhizopus azygosporus]|uniref:Uncharacterized protein n=1 Tax=Rhizopus azygosporus TaxID=86630 RepID=A0A367JYR5_RHIAZ|nr:hypothetical protein CU097_007121 [Rhizopus azygosporus]
MTNHPRKVQKVYYSPTLLEKPKASQHMDIDAEDEEAGTILVALAKQANRMNSNIKLPSIMLTEKPTRSHSMSIKNLIDTESTDVTPCSSYSTGHDFYQSSQRQTLELKIRRSSIHVHISYKIHAHKIRAQHTHSTYYPNIHHHTASYHPIIPYHYKDNVV